MYISGYNVDFHFCAYAELIALSCIPLKTDELNLNFSVSFNRVSSVLQFDFINFRFWFGSSRLHTLQRKGISALTAFHLIFF